MPLGPNPICRLAVISICVSLALWRKSGSYAAAGGADITNSVSKI
jgi:hypothetical protein